MDNYIDLNASNGNAKVRLKAFDFLKFFAIFLVLWGHSIQGFLSSNYYDEPVYRIIYSFHMPMFMMISGYFSLSSMSLPPSVFIKKKFIQLLLPTFSWLLIREPFLYFSQTQFLTDNSVQWLTHLKNIFSFILSDSLNSFWFLKTCFFCYLFVYCGNRLRLNKYVWMFIALIINHYIPLFANFDIMYPCFIIGMELKNNQNFYNLTRRNFLYFGGAFLLMLCFWDQFFWGYDGVIKTMLLNYLHTDNHLLLMIVSKLYKVVIGIVGSLASIGLICSLIPQERKSKLISLCCNCGQYTLGIYILQNIILETYIADYLKLDDLNFMIFNFIITPIISLIVLMLCIQIIKIIYKSPLLAFWLLGKQIRKN